MPSFTASATPHGAIHSPRTRSLNCPSRSTTRTRAPCPASTLASAEPPSPPPTVITSYSVLMSGSSLYAEVHRDFELGSVGLWIRWQMRGPSLALARSERLVDGRAHLCERVAFAWRRANRIAVCAHPEPCLLMVPQFETAASISPALWRHCLSPCLSRSSQISFRCRATFRGLIEGSFPSHGFIGSVADNFTLKRIVPHWHAASISLRWSMG